MRKEAILRILDKEERPIRGIELYEKLIQMPEGYKFGGLGEVFWYSDFPSFMNRLVEEGLVYKFKPRYEQKVFYYITNKGRAFVRPRDMQKLLRRHLRYYIRRLVAQHVADWMPFWSNDEVKAQIDNLIPKIKDGEKYFKRYMLSAYIHQKIEYYKDDIFKDRAFRVEQIREHFLPDLTDEEVNRQVKKRLKQAIPRAVRVALRWRDVEEITWENTIDGRLKVHIGWMEELDPTFDARAIFEEAKQLLKIEKETRKQAFCVLCGVRISRTAEKLAKALQEKTGLEAGAVCCHCYKKLREEENEYGANSSSC